ncbi:nucleoside deaminase [Mycobacterium sp.]|uniref:nucleoside deaminase n=1 Tax=Mycobacterium sp. TaxID=1785 RepID=UPI003C71D86E
MMDVAFEEAQAGLTEGGIPIGAALFTADGVLLGRGRNRRVQQGDPSLHAEVDAFRAAGRRLDYRSTVMVTTLSPCWYCSGLVRQFNIGSLLVGEARTFSGGHGWLADNGITVTVLDDRRCAAMMSAFIAVHPGLWHEDIGEAR